MTIVFVFDDNQELRMKCTDFSMQENALGQIISYKAKGITENKPVYMPLESVKRIYRVVSDEQEGETE